MNITTSPRDIQKAMHIDVMLAGTYAVFHHLHTINADKYAAGLADLKDQKHTHYIHDRNAIRFALDSMGEFPKQPWTSRATFMPRVWKKIGESSIYKSEIPRRKRWRWVDDCWLLVIYIKTHNSLRPPSLLSPAPPAPPSAACWTRHHTEVRPDAVGPQWDPNGTGQSSSVIIPADHVYVCMHPPPPPYPTHHSPHPRDEPTRH